MDKPIIVAIVAVSIVMGSSVGLTGFQSAYAQYTTGQTSGSIEEQLNLAREKVSNAQQQGAYGSGTAMLGVNIDQTAIFVGVLVAIFGGVAAALLCNEQKQEIGNYKLVS